MPCYIPEEQSEFSDCKFSHLVSAQAALLVQAVTVNTFSKYGSFFFLASNYNPTAATVFSAGLALASCIKSTTSPVNLRRCLPGFIKTKSTVIGKLIECNYKPGWKSLLLGDGKNFRIKKKKKKSWTVQLLYAREPLPAGWFMFKQ